MALRVQEFKTFLQPRRLPFNSLKPQQLIVLYRGRTRGRIAACDMTIDHLLIIWC